MSRKLEKKLKNSGKDVRFEEVVQMMKIVGVNGASFRKADIGFVHAIHEMTVPAGRVSLSYDIVVDGSKEINHSIAIYDKVAQGTVVYPSKTHRIPKNETLKQAIAKFIKYAEQYNNLFALLEEARAIRAIMLREYVAQENNFRMNWDKKETFDAPR